MSDQLRDAMEMVATHADQLEKMKIASLPVPTPASSTTQPTQQALTGRVKRKSTATSAYAEWDSCQYKGTEEQHKKDRENRRLLRERKRKEEEKELARKVEALALLGDNNDEKNVEEEAEITEAGTEAPASEKPTESISSKNRKLEAERRKKAKKELDAAKAEAAKKQSEELPRRKSPARATKKQTADPPKVKSLGQTNTGGKTPKSKGKVALKTSSKTDDHATDQGVEPKKKTKATTSSKTDNHAMD